MQSVLQVLMNGATVVTSRPIQARHLQQHYSRLQRRGNKKAWPTPDVLHWGAWLERCWDEATVAGAAIGEYQLLRRPHARLVWQDIVAQHAAELNAATAAILAQRTWELAQAWSIALDDVRARVATDDTRMFLEWADAYRRRCEYEHWLDLPSLSTELGEKTIYGLASQRTPVRFFGFSDITPQQQRVFDRFGAVVNMTGRGSGGTQDSLARLSCPDEAREIELAATWLQGELHRRPDALVGIATPKLRQNPRKIERQVLQILQPDWHSRPATERAVTVENSQPLAQSGPVRSALLALRLPSGFMAYDEFGELLRSPFLVGGIDEAAERALLDVRIRDRNEREISVRALTVGDDLDVLPKLSRLLGTALGLSSQFAGRQSPSRWSMLISRYLAKIGWCAERDSSSADDNAVQAWQRLLELYSASGMVSGRVTFRDARRYLARAATDEFLSQRPAQPSAVQIMSLTDAAGCSFDAIWVAGLTRESWPPPAAPNPLIPLDIQRERGIPDAEPSLYQAQHADVLRDILQHSCKVSVSWPQQSEEAAQRPHPIFDGDEHPLHRAPERPAAATRRGMQLARRGTEQLASDPPPPMRAGEKARGGSKLFRLQAACPARAFFELRLAAAELPVPAFGIDARTRGVFIHAALEELYRRIATVGGVFECTTDALTELAERAIERAATKFLPSRDALSTLLATHERVRLRELIGELIAIERSRDAFVVASIEGRDEVTVGPLKIALRHDRIDQINHGARLVLDYKTGQTFRLRDWLGPRPAEPQLPLYAATSVVDGIVVILLNESGVNIHGVARPDCEFANVVAPESKPFANDWNGLVDGWRASLEMLADEFFAGDCRIDPRNPRLAAHDYAMLIRIGDLA